MPSWTLENGESVFGVVTCKICLQTFKTLGDVPVHKCLQKSHKRTTMSDPVQNFIECVEIEGLEYAIRFKRNWEVELPYQKGLCKSIQKFKKAAQEIESWIEKNREDV